MATKTYVMERQTGSIKLHTRQRLDRQQMDKRADTGKNIIVL